MNGLIKEVESKEHDDDTEYDADYSADSLILGACHELLNKAHARTCRDG